MKEEPNVIFHNSKFYVLTTESSFINLCDSFDKDNPTLPNVVVLFFVNLQVNKEQLQADTFSSVVDSLKAMSLTLHACSELKSLDYDAITIEFVNCLPTKFNGDILFELPPIRHPLG